MPDKTCPTCIHWPHCPTYKTHVRTVRANSLPTSFSCGLYAAKEAPLANTR